MAFSKALGYLPSRMPKAAIIFSLLRKIQKDQAHFNDLPEIISLTFIAQMRIVSTVPSQTELLYDLGLTDEVIGITKFCVHPPHWRKEKDIIGGTKNLNIEKIKSLNPDLIIANKEENTKEQIEDLAKDIQVHVTEIKSIEDNITLIKQIAQLTETENRCKDLINRMETFLAQSIRKKINKKKALYLIWQDPMMSVGGDTFIHSMMEYCGYENVMKETIRYPELLEDEIKSMNPQVIMLSSEPYPFKEKHIAFYKDLLPKAKIILVDGEAFSWYGTRVLKKADYLHSLQA